MFTIILIPFSTALMAEYLNTPHSQPAIMIYCLNTVLDTIGWLVLYYSAQNPISLLKDSKAIAIHKNALKILSFNEAILHYN